MSTWRRKAIALFPELRNHTSLDDPEYTIYMLFFDLLPMSREAHQTQNDELLRRIYGYAEWCSHQPQKELWNPAAVAFWEHAFDQRQVWHAIIPWLSPFVIEQITPLWSGLTLTSEWDEVKALIADCKQHFYRESVFW